MQVFVPYSDLNHSIKALDSKRLRKQGLEASQLLDVIFSIPTKSGKPRKGWLKHPALLAWQNYPIELLNYLKMTRDEIKFRQFKTEYLDLKIDEILSLVEVINSSPLPLNTAKPVWLGDEKIHSSHRARLLQKGVEEFYKYGDKAQTTIEWYARFQWLEMKDPNLLDVEYYWPTNITASTYSLETRASKSYLDQKKEIIDLLGKNPLL
jgi:hypothetical protein